MQPNPALVYEQYSAVKCIIATDPRYKSAIVTSGMRTPYENPS